MIVNYENEQEKSTSEDTPLSQKAPYKSSYLPILLLTALQDEVIPYYHSSNLFHLFGPQLPTESIHRSFDQESHILSMTVKDRLKQWCIFSHGSHNTLCLQKGYFNMIRTFVTDLL